MKQPGLDQRHRDKNGEISRKHRPRMIIPNYESDGVIGVSPPAIGWLLLTGW
jgi:hypothetical protein